MPESVSPSVTPARRRRTEDNGDDSDYERSEAARSRHSKRARSQANGNLGDEETAAVDDSWYLSPPPGRADAIDGPLLPDSYIVSPEKTSRIPQDVGKETPSSYSDHKAGAIVRIKLERFVTYTNVELFPGPALNMVIGPNGTGKSTLVCAICLGLGWGPQHLGRAKEASEFIKRGFSEATIEIELKSHDGYQNQVIKRHIKRDGNKTHWFLNGHVSNLKSVLSVAKGFNIQIDNLCQFLPQDRVVEFAALSPVDLLTSTQKAACPEYMVEWHEELKRLRAEEKKEQAEEMATRNSLNSLEKRQDLQRSDVDRLRQRTDVIKELRLLEAIRPFAEYAEAFDKNKAIQARKALLIEELEALKADVEPTLASMKSKTEYKDAIEKALKQQKTKSEKAEQKVEIERKKMEDLDDKIKTCDVQQKAELKFSTESKQIKSRLENEIRHIKVSMAETPIDFDPADYNARIRHKQAEQREIEDEIEDHRLEGREKRGQEEQKKAQIRDSQQQLENLSSQAGQRENKLRRESPDTAEAWTWIKKHQDEFEATIFGPAMTECSVTDMRYVNLIEAVLQRNDFLAFSCTTRSDFRKLQDQLYGKLNLKDISIRMAGTSRDDFPAPVSDDIRQTLGLDGWAIDYLTGPETVLAMLCEARLNQTGVSLQDNAQQFEQLEKSRVNAWVTTKSAYQINRRQEYGAGATSTRVREVKQAQFWTSQTVDVRLQNEIQGNIEVWKSEAMKLRREMELVGERIKELERRKECIISEKVEIEDEKGEKQRALAAYNALPAKLADKEAKLNDQIERERKVRDRIEALKDEENVHALAKAELAIALSESVSTVRRLYQELLEVSVAFIEAQSDHETLCELNSSISERLDGKEKEIQDVSEELRQSKASSRTLLNRVREAKSDEVVEYFESLPEALKKRYPAELDLEIEAKNAQLDLLHAGNPGAIREFEERQLRIDEKRARLAALASTLSTLSTTITSLREQWEPELRALISKISSAFAASFATIHCGGEVQLHAPGADFDAWAVHAYVKFRDGEALARLDAHRQSGGERAVATIFYLMALQSLSRAPFRVVDEINQGMDPRNERLVHERMVDIACGAADADHTHSNHVQDSASAAAAAAAGSQYFLITPKLLSGLKYSPGMVVHCIASGEMMPADCRKLDFRALVARARALRDEGEGRGEGEGGGGGRDVLEGENGDGGRAVVGGLEEARRGVVVV